MLLAIGYNYVIAKVKRFLPTFPPQGQSLCVFKVFVSALVEKD